MLAVRLRTLLAALRCFSLTHALVLRGPTCRQLADKEEHGPQYVLPPNSTAYLGCVGADALADQLRAANEKEGLQSAYQVVEDKPTGACAVVITDHNRCAPLSPPPPPQLVLSSRPEADTSRCNSSLCTNLAAAEAFSVSHLDKPEIKDLIERAQNFYLGGFFLTHGLESALVLAKHAAEKNKVRRCG